MAHVFLAKMTPSDQWDADMSVYQKRADNTLAHVAFVRSNYHGNEFQDTFITFSGGEITFSEQHDWLQPYYDSGFHDSKKNRNVASLIHFPGNKQYYLRGEDGLYPIVAQRDKNGKRKIVMYTPYESTAMGLQHRVFAQITAAEHPWSYEIRLNTLPETELLMAIFSLPQTARYAKME